MIFVQIAAYRDPQLEPTINDCLKKAKHKDNIVFGILDQLHQTDPITHLQGNCRYKRVISSESRGVCWARNVANSLFYQGEEYYLQIDSHTRFVENWDEILLAQLERSNKPNPILTGYPNMYWLGDRGEDVFGECATNVTVATGFNDSKMLTLEPRTFHISEPRNAIAMAGGFIFTTGNFVKQVLYDPNIYFLGEEIILSILAFTSGFDLVHPSLCPLYHFYTRKDSVRHWAENTRWVEWNDKSTKYVLNLLSGGEKNYFGKARTLQQYEAYSRISFKHNIIDDDTKIGIEPKM